MFFVLTALVVKKQFVLNILSDFLNIFIQQAKLMHLTVFSLFSSVICVPLPYLLHYVKLVVFSKTLKKE